MAPSKGHGPILLAVLGILVSTCMAKNETQSPSYNCLGGPAFGLNAACDFNNFEGLQSHAPSEILYQIVMQSKLPNDTYFSNDSHVTCLFADKSFILDFGGGAGAGPAEVNFDLHIENSGSKSILKTCTSLPS